MKKNNKRGFTLTELIVVIVIIGILAAVLVPSVTKYIESARNAAAKQEAAPYITALSSYNIEYLAGTLTKNQDGKYVTFDEYCTELGLSIETLITIEVITDSTSDPSGVEPLSMVIEAASASGLATDGFIMWAKFNRLIAYNHYFGSTKVINLNQDPLTFTDTDSEGDNVNTPKLTMNIDSLASFKKFKNVVEASKTEEGTHFNFGSLTSAGGTITTPSVMATQGLKYTLNSDEQTCKVLDGDVKASGTLIIPSYYNDGNGRMYKVTEIAASAFESNNAITSVYIPSTVETIGKQAFLQCAAVEEVYIPSSIKSIKENAFGSVPSSLKNLKKVKTDSLESWLSINFENEYSNPFNKYCDADFYIGDTKITEIILPSDTKFDTVNQHVFANCRTITSVYIPSNIKTINSKAFFQCVAIEKVNIDDLEAYLDIDFKDVNSTPFSGTTDSSDFNGSNKAFLYVKGVKTTVIDIPKSVKNIKPYVFARCTTIEKVNLHSEVETIGEYSFNTCGNLKEINIPNSVISIGARAFFDCKNIEKVYIDSIVSWCGITYPTVDSTPFRASEKATFYINGEATTEIDLTGVTTINKFAFAYCKTIKSFNFPNTLTKIEDNAFQNCMNVENVYTESLESWLSIGRGNIGSSPFYSSGNANLITKNNNQSITSVELTNGVPSHAFYNYNGLISATITGTIGQSAFQNCAKLISVVIKNDVNSTSIGVSAFNGCTSLKSIEIPSSVVSIGDYAFNKCSALSIYTEYDTIPVSTLWTSKWNSSGRPVLLGCTFNDDGSLNSFTSVVNASTIVSNPIREGYTFVGCYKESIANVINITGITESGIYYALWEKEGVVNLKTKVGENVSSLNDLTELALAGYSFLGWSLTEDGDILDSEDSLEDIEYLYARFKKVQSSE